MAVGNACVLLGALGGAEGARHCEALLRAGACDLVVEALKTVGDGAAQANVRRNASVAVARLVRAHRGCEARIRELRGMEILVTLERDGGFKSLAS